jgi:arylsulfatase A-like enzyme
MQDGSRRWPALLLSGTLAGFVLSLPEGFLVLRGTGSLLGASGGMLLALSGAALCGSLLGLVLWATGWLVIPGGPGRGVDWSARMLELVAFDHLEPDGSRRLLAIQISALPAVAGFFAIWFIFGRLFIEKLHNQNLMVLGGILAALGALGAMAAGAWSLYRLLLWALRTISFPRNSLPVIVMLLPTLFPLTAVAAFSGFHVIRLASVVQLQWLPQLAVLVGAGTLIAVPGASFLRRVRPTASVIVVLFLVATYALMGNLAATRRPVQAAGSLSRLTLSLMASFSDVDGDGFGSLFGGTDCGPFDDTIHPAAREVPGNGIDENCNGTDGENSLDGELSSTLVLREQVADLFERPPNVLMVTWDAARGDHISYTGYRPSTTPFLKSLAESSSVFLQAYSAGPNTHSSVPALITGKNIFSVALRKHPKSKMLILLQEENVTLAELLKEKGYRTAAVVSHRFFTKKHHWDQGFDRYSLAVRSKSKTVSSPRILKKARAYIAEHKKKHRRKPLFLWAHFYDPHATYIAHEGTPFPTTTMTQRYDSELWYTDKHTRELVAAMRTLEGPTIIVFTSDHGDELGEHGEYGQHRTLHKENTHVPLLVHVPGLPAQEVIEAVSTTDIFPTIADLVGADLPDDLRGVSLLPGLFDGSMEGRGPVFSEVAWRFNKPPEHWISATLGRARLLKEMRSGRHEFYLVDVDPEEHNDLSGRGYEEEEYLLEYITRFLETTTIPTKDTESVP